MGLRWGERLKLAESISFLQREEAVLGPASLGMRGDRRWPHAANLVHLKLTIKNRPEASNSISTIFRNVASSSRP